MAKKKTGKKPQVPERAVTDKKRKVPGADRKISGSEQAEIKKAAAAAHDAETAAETIDETLKDAAEKAVTDTAAEKTAMADAGAAEGAVKKAEDGEKKPDGEEDWTTTENVYERIARREHERTEPKLKTVQVSRDYRERTEEPSAPVEEAPQETSSHKKHSGPPLTEEQRRRIAAMENLLDRDLDSVRQKRDEEEAAERQRQEARRKKDQERIDRLARRQRELEEREAHAKEHAKLLEEAKAQAKLQGKDDVARETAGGATSHGTSKVRDKAVEKSFNAGLFQMGIFRVVLLILVLLGLLYAAAFLYTRNINEKFYDDLTVQLTGQDKLVSDQSRPYTLPGSAGMTEDQKSSASLSKWLPDSDYDGLVDTLEIQIGSNPLKRDTNGNKIPDGAEYMTGNDPAAPANDTITDSMTKELTLTSDRLTLNVHGIPISGNVSVEPVGNNSINGTPGLIEHAYEIWATEDPGDMELTFAYPVNIVQSKGYNESALSVFRFDSEDLTFHQVQSQHDAESATVTAHVKESGIYAVCDTSVVMQKGSTQVFFLIDNSGSMYPEELCKGSEENDVNFKRLDFATSLIDMIGDQARYGAGEFSGNYTNIVPISDDRENVKAKISALRDVVPPFSGTNIANAINKAISEFGTINAADKNYIILLTDGMNSKADPALDNAVIEAAKKCNITVFTVGLGKDIDANYLNTIASETNGQFFQATNADALANIYEKIEHFMSYNQVIIEEETGRKGYIVADSGLNVKRDGIGYNNFRSDFAPNGADVGIAGLIRDYYTGALADKADGYTTKDGRKVPGYDISGIAELKDGKLDLRDIKVGLLDKYDEYLIINKKWAFNNVSDSMLTYTPKTREFIDKAGFRVISAGFDFKAPEETEIDKLLRKITFHEVKPFRRYECVLIDSSLATGSDLEVLNMIHWYNDLPNSAEHQVYDFGYDGDTAFEVLTTELEKGAPAVIIYNGSALNAIRLTRDIKDPDLFVLDAYDSNTPDRATKIEMRRTPLYSNGRSSYQYAASRNGTEAPMQILVK